MSARAESFAALLWIPLPFYIYSVAYGSVPIFIPQLWPHAFYNARYGMEPSLKRVEVCMVQRPGDRDRAIALGHELALAGPRNIRHGGANT